MAALKIEVPPERRDDLLRELLALELEYSTKQGEQPTPHEFERLFPQHRELIHQAFRDVLPPVPGAPLLGSFRLRCPYCCSCAAM